MKFLTLIPVLGICFFSQAFADIGELKITPKMLSFDYSTSEGDFTLDCTPTLKDALSQDWLVNCGTAATSTRQYLVHLWVTMYERPLAPEQSYEVLYWITDLSKDSTPAANASSTTIWFNFDKTTTFTQLDIRLGVENDNASLHMVINPLAK